MKLVTSLSQNLVNDQVCQMLYKVLNKNVDGDSNDN